MAEKPIRVFVWKKDPRQRGNGFYKMGACFLEWGVHVLYTFSAHSENDTLRHVGEASACDGSCHGKQGYIVDFGRKGDTDEYSKTPIVEKAQVFYCQQQSA